MAKISAVIHTLNEEKNIRNCLECLHWVDEIVIIDMYSDDKTVEICREYTDKVIPFARMGYADPARRFGLEQTTGDWVLVVDADERITPALAAKLREIAEKDEFDVVEIPRKNYIFGKWIRYTGWYPDYLIRFFRRGFVLPAIQVHGQDEVKGRRTRLDASNDELAIVHFNYVSCFQFIEKMNRYTTFEVEKMAGTGEEIKQFSVPKMLREALHEAKSRYISRKGYKDGIRGLFLSLFMGFYRLLAYAKYWEYVEYQKNKPEEIYAGIDEILKTEHMKAGFKFTGKGR